jgi:hypothetical protein
MCGEPWRQAAATSNYLLGTGNVLGDFSSVNCLSTSDRCYPNVGQGGNTTQDYVSFPMSTSIPLAKCLTATPELEVSSITGASAECYGSTPAYHKMAGVLFTEATNQSIEFRWSPPYAIRTDLTLAMWLEVASKAGGSGNTRWRISYRCPSNYTLNINDTEASNRKFISSNYTFGVYSTAYVSSTRSVWSITTTALSACIDYTYPTSIWFNIERTANDSLDTHANDVILVDVFFKYAIGSPLN